MLRTSFAAQGVGRAILERFLRRYRRLPSAAFGPAAGPGDATSIRSSQNACRNHREVATALQAGQAF